jgi:hypothetical protein
LAPDHGKHLQGMVASPCARERDLLKDGHDS